MAKLNPGKTGLALGSFAALLVLLFSIILAIGGSSVSSYWLRVHFISGITFQPVTFGTAIISIIHHFVVGLVLGWLFAMIWNKVQK